MNDASPRERFLAAEEEATQIVETLNRLRAETEGYRDARQSVEAALEATRAVAQALSPISVQFQELLSALEELGYTAFREDLNAIGRVLQELQSGQNDLKSRQSSLVTQERFEKTLAGLGEAIGGVEKKISALAEQQRNLHKTVEAEASRQQKRHRWALALVGVIAVLVVIMALLT